MKITIEKIGVIELGVEGSDDYILVKTENRATIAQVRGELLSRFFRDTTQEAGGYYCHHVTVLGNPVFDNSFVAIIHHRYDV